MVLLGECSVREAEAGAGEAAGISLWPLGPCSRFIPIPGAGAGFQRKKVRASYRGNYVRGAQFR